MGINERIFIRKIAEMGLKAKISTWNRILVSDVQWAASCGNVIIHLSVPASELQIKRKLNKERKWVLDNMLRCIDLARIKGHEVTIGLEDASRAEFNFISEIADAACKNDVSMIRYADTVGVLYRKKISEDIKKLKEIVNCDIGIHTHNDLGMAVANAIAAAQAGAAFVDVYYRLSPALAEHVNHSPLLASLVRLLLLPVLILSEGVLFPIAVMLMVLLFFAGLVAFVWVRRSRASS